MAVTRIKAYHGARAAINNSVDYITNEKKTDMEMWQERLGKEGSSTEISNAIQYAVNLEKTSVANEEPPRYVGEIGTKEVLVSGYMCNPSMAPRQFNDLMDQYRSEHGEYLGEQTAKRIFRAKLDESGKPVLDDKGEMIYDDKAPVWHDKDGKCRYQEYKKETKPRTAYMWILSFPPEKVCGYKIDPRICHQIGLEFIKQIDGGQYPAVVATHMDREHPHDHIVMSAYSVDGTHKYRDTKESLMRARQICDDLSKKFGLPIIQTMSQEQSQTISWKEWKAKQEGQSWKEQMRQDINGTARVAKSFDHFIELMKSSGYGIRETDNHVTYTMPGDEGFRCRDTRLGKEYEKAAIKEQIEHKMAQSPEMSEVKEHEISYKPDQGLFKPVRIYVARYTFSGRRRSDLEMAFLTAVRIIQELRNLFRDTEASEAQPTNPVHQDYTWKLGQMMDSLRYAQELGLENKEDLSALLNETGTKLSVAKSEVKELELDRAYVEKVHGLIEDAEKYMTLAEKIHFNLDDLHINKLNSYQIRENLAKASPATPSQRRELYLQLQKEGVSYRLGCKYDQLSAREAGEIISFLQNKTDNKPEILFEGRWKPEKRQEESFEEMQKRNEENDVLFESHLLDYSPMQQQMILNLRSTIQQLSDFGIDIDKYGDEKALVVSELDYLDSRLKDVEDLSAQYRSLKRLEYNLTLAETTAFTHGAAYEKEKEDLVEVHETREKDTEKERPDDGQKAGNKNKSWVFNYADSYFDNTHGGHTS